MATATMTTTMTTTSAGSEWKSRMQKRRDFELTMLRRPSETAIENKSLSESTSSSTHTPPSPKSNHSSTKASHKSHQSFDQLHALQLQLERNAAQIAANEARMRELETTDNKMGADIQDRLSTVSQLNQQLSLLREMLSRAERVSRGEFGVGVE